jgi:NAD(P)H-dependent FMN reductase
MKIIALCGSASTESSNEQLLKAIQKAFSKSFDIEVFAKLNNFPLFRPEDLNKTLTSFVLEFKEKLERADAVIISTPEYTHNIPAVLKNALEWITASGELQNKKVLPITFTPHEPRGEWAMKSLLFSLLTMKANVVAKLPLYRNDFEFDDRKIILSGDNKMMINEALKLFK